MAAEPLATRNSRWPPFRSMAFWKVRVLLETSDERSRARLLPRKFAVEAQTRAVPLPRLTVRAAPKAEKPPSAVKLTWPPAVPKAAV